VEVTAKIQFVRPCLGNVRRSDYDRMEHDQDGNVIFLPTWWRAAFAKAAQAINKHHKLVDNIHPALRIYGTMTKIERQYYEQRGDSSVQRIKVHEGFDAGTTVECSFLLPSEITANQFTELLEVVGLYFGISPYGWRQDFGRFRVLSVDKTTRNGRIRAETGRNGPAKDVDRSAAASSGSSRP